MTRPLRAVATAPELTKVMQKSLGKEYHVGWQYRGWDIRYDPPPIPTRCFDYQATGPNYDASREGEEDGWTDNGEKASGGSLAEVCADIDAWFEEQSA